MGHKKACFKCRKAFSVYKNDSDEINLTCPECGLQTALLNHKFKPPKQDDTKKWKVAEFLKDNGFFYDHTYEQINGRGYIEVPYPDTMEEAKDFVKKHKKSK
jgi:predicted  nucleic acid-binding Zn-ribbon protein